MAENETSVSGDVVWQDGDDISETNLTRSAAKSNLTDYVERGMGFAVDHAADTVDIGSGHVIIQDGVDAYDLFPNQQTDISLPNTSAVNYVYVAHQPGTDDDVYYHIDDDDTAPADPSLKIGTIDTANNSADDTINRNPDADFGDTTHDSVSTEEGRVTERFDIDHSDNFPFLGSRVAESSGPPTFQPHPDVTNPILTAADVTNAGIGISDATDVTDPYIVKDGATYYIFAEVVRSGSNNDIVWFSSDDPLSWGQSSVGQQIFSDGTRRSHPWVRKLDGIWYLVPEESPDFVIYEFDNFPASVTKVETALSGTNTVDFTPIFWNDRWYAFARDTGTNEIEIYSADSEGESLTGQSWSPHPNNPVHSVSADGTQKPTGKWVNTGESIISWYQTDTESVKQFVITQLSTSSYRAHETQNSPVLTRSLSGWTENTMGHLDPLMESPWGTDIALVHGKNASGEGALGIFTSSYTPFDDWRAYLDTDTSVSANDGEGEITNNSTVDPGDNQYQGGNRYQAPADGWYKAEGRVTWSAPSTTGFTLQAQIRHFDGSTQTDYDVDYAEVNISGHNVTNDVSTGVRYLNAGDFLILDVENNDGSNSHTVLSGEHKTWLSVERLA